jgi:hypothetical protein
MMVREVINMKNMIRKMIILLTAGLLITGLAACQKKVETQGNQEGSEVIVGGWEKVEDGTITEELQEIFDKAIEGLTGVGYKPIRLVEKQIVSGTNYKFLCEATTVTANPTTREAYVIVYQDLQGNVSILEIQDEGLEDLPQIPNPFAGFETLEESEAAVGFEIELPGKSDGYVILNTSVMSGKMLQIDFENGTMVRKMAGSEDISGDYNQYQTIEEAAVNNVPATLRINDGKVYSAIWEDGGYSYAFFNSEGISMTDAFILIASVK